MAIQKTMESIVGLKVPTFNYVFQEKASFIAFQYTRLAHKISFGGLKINW